MAGIAADAGMCAPEFEVGLPVVIKDPEIPGDRVMTRLAVGLKNAVVVVIFSMTVDTLAAGICKSLCLVACIALDIRVFTK